MPANLPPQYTRPRTNFARVPTPAERLEKLREMFRLLPKHKGTEKLQSDLKQKISRPKDEIEGARRRGKKAGVSHRVPHEGAGQVVLVGPPNAGKSATPGGADQRPARGRRVSVHDPGPAAGDHDVGGRPGPARRPAAGLGRVPGALGARRDPLGRRRAPGRRPGQRRRGRGASRRCSSGWRRLTPSSSARCRTTWRTRRPGTSRRCWSPTSPTPRGRATGWR